MRIAFNIAIIASIFFFPWWLTAILVLAAVSLVGRFYEAIAYGILVDALYGTSMGYRGFPYMATAYSVIVFILANAVRKRVVW